MSSSLNSLGFLGQFSFLTHLCKLSLEEVCVSVCVCVRWGPSSSKTLRLQSTSRREAPLLGCR